MWLRSAQVFVWVQKTKPPAPPPARWWPLPPLGQVKVTALTRLVVSLYAFSALALMLHMQLHILGE